MSICTLRERGVAGRTCALPTIGLSSSPSLEVAVGEVGQRLHITGSGTRFGRIATIGFAVEAVEVAMVLPFLGCNGLRRIPAK